MVNHKKIIGYIDNFNLFLIKYVKALMMLSCHDSVLYHVAFALFASLWDHTYQYQNIRNINRTAHLIFSLYPLFIYDARTFHKVPCE